jgi:hypothetical protein
MAAWRNTPGLNLTTGTSAGWGGGVLDHGDHSIGHEPAGPNHLAAPGDLGDLDDPPPGGHLDPPAGPGGLDVEPLDPPAGVDHDLHSVTLHRPILDRAADGRGGRKPDFTRTRGLTHTGPGQGPDETHDKGGDMKKFLILLGIIGLVIAVTMYLRNRQGESEF